VPAFLGSITDSPAAIVDAIPALHASVYSPVPPVIGTVEAINKQPSRSGSFHGLEAP